MQNIILLSGLFLIILIKDDMRTTSFDKSGYLFIKSLVNPNSGLVTSTEAEVRTTLYKNALAAMAFIHEGDLLAAEIIFDSVNKYYQANQKDFHGFPQTWNAVTGLPDTGSIHWEGDSAVLLLALNYYQQTTGRLKKYNDLVNGIVAWLVQQTDLCHLILAEGIAEIYAALAPFFNNREVQKSLLRLRQCFYGREKICSTDYEHNLNHIIHGALVFGDSSGFKYLPNFVRSEIWDYNKSIKITACSAFATDLFINVGVSTQVLLVLKILSKQKNAPFLKIGLRGELEKLFLAGKQDQKAQGLPYFVGSHGGSQSCRYPALEPTCYMLFYYWGFNPFQIADLQF